MKKSKIHVVNEGSNKSSKNLSSRSIDDSDNPIDRIFKQLGINFGNRKLLKGIETRFRDPSVDLLYHIIDCIAGLSEIIQMCNDSAFANSVAKKLAGSFVGNFIF
jgi:hypothetical protein